MTRWCSVLAFGRTYDLAKATDSGVLVAMRGQWAVVPWHCVEQIRDRASYHRFGDAPWRTPSIEEAAA